MITSVDNGLENEAYIRMTVLEMYICVLQLPISVWTCEANLPNFPVNNGKGYPTRMTWEDLCEP
jgi:hypothetical protein